MTAPTEIYVDPAIAGNSGSGTSGDPYGDLQYALDQTTSQGTGGDRFNIKAGTDEVLSAALSLASGYGGTPTAAKPVIFEGYTSTAGDGGTGGISGNGSVSIHTARTDHVHWKHLHLHNCGSADILQAGFLAVIYDVEFDNTTGDGIGTSDQRLHIEQCNFHNIGTYGVDLSPNSIVRDCYFANGTNDFNAAIFMTSGQAFALYNILSLDGASNGIVVSDTYGWIMHNSVLASSGTGSGIYIDANWDMVGVWNNVAEGFSGTGGYGFEFGIVNKGGIFEGNAAYNNATNYDSSDEWILDGSDNETLSASGFDKSGSDTFANRYTYFAPADEGNMRNGAFPSGARRDKGAVQHADPAGGGGTSSFIIGG